MARKIIFLCIMLALTSTVWADSERAPMALEGATIHALRGNEDGSLIFLGAEFSPKSIYYSKDFGATWQYAAGGDYDFGTIRGLEIFDNWVYAVLDRKLRRSALPSSGEVSGWTPSWSTIPGPLGVAAAFKLTAQQIFATDGTAKIGYIHNIADSIIDTNVMINAPAGGSYRKVVGGSAYIVAQVDQAASGDRGQGNSALYRIAFDPSTGQVSGSWESIIDRLPGVTVSQADILSVHVNSATNTIYVVVRDYVSQTDLTFSSNNDGTSFIFEPTINIAFNHTCFNGNTWLFSGYLSTDAGNTFNEIQIGASFDTLRVDRGGCYIVPNDPNKAMTATTVGVAFSTDINATQNWQISRAGLQGVVVNRISQAGDNKDRAAMATYSGVAYTNNFTSAQPTWIYPMCAAGNCNVLDYVVIDPNDSTKIYAGGKPTLARGTVSGDGQSVTWAPWGNSPFMSGNYGTFDIFNFEGLKNRLYVTWWKNEGGLDGGIFYYPLSYDGVGTQNAVAINDPNVSGKPIASLHAISSSVMFANRGGTRSAEESALLAILQSRDSGETWTVMETGDLPSQPYIADWVYDWKRDTLYVGISSMGTPFGWTGAPVGGVYMLKGAAAGTGAWRKAAGRFLDKNGLPADPFNLSNLAVDAESGKVFVSADNRIWFTDDEGATFHLAFTGPADEKTEDLEVDADPAATAQGFFRATTRRARLAQGANSGLYAFDIDQMAAPPAQPTPVPTTAATPIINPTATVPAPTPTPVRPKGVCTLTVAKACTRSVKKRTSCEMKVSMRQVNKKAAARARFRLERSALKAGPWVAASGTQTTDRTGVKIFKTRVSATSYYRAVGVSHSCTSRSVQIKVTK